MAGDIVWCNFPYEDMPGKPGPKPRPAIVRLVFIDILTSRASIEVAFGTSKKTDKLHRGEFLVGSPSGMTCAGLDLPMKFDLGRTVRLPWARQYFSIKPGNTRLVMGSLHPTDVLVLRQAVKALT
ncbi:MAG: hypothetical protein IIC08_00860 [Proteobacteria bacterium]|nr:hypothetical protein [Pseudomonadota bacterium]